jgi:hypothetical protein
MNTPKETPTQKRSNSNIVARIRIEFDVEAYWQQAMRCTKNHFWTPMFALGHKQTYGHVRFMSALPPKEDIG